MTLESYFNHKKNLLAVFFNNFQHLLQELSIVVQLEVDNEYFAAKNLMKQATPDSIENYCQDMMGKEGELLRKIIDTVCGNVGKYCGLGRERVKTLEDLQRNQEINFQKTEEKKLISTNQSEPKRSVDMGRVMSLDRLQKSQEDRHSTASKIKNIRGIQTVGRNSLELFNLKTKTKQQKQQVQPKQNEYQQKPSLPINLLNKRRQNSSRKGQQRTDRKQTGFKSENQNKPMFRNYSGQLQPYSVQKQRKNTQQFHHEKLSYQKYRQNHQSHGRGQDLNINQKQSNLWTSSKVSEGSKVNEGIIQSNQILCEKLDQRIQESAMEILNKVKPKRSPVKKKNYQSISSKGSKPVNAFSVLDISQSSILLTRPSVLRINK